MRGWRQKLSYKIFSSTLLTVFANTYVTQLNSHSVVRPERYVYVKKYCLLVHYPQTLPRIDSAGGIIAGVLYDSSSRYSPSTTVMGQRKVLVEDFPVDQHCLLMRLTILHIVDRRCPHVVLSRHVYDLVHRHNRAQPRQAASQCLPVLPAADAQYLDGPKLPPLRPQYYRSCPHIVMERSDGSGGCVMDYQSGYSTNLRCWNLQIHLDRPAS